MKNHMTKILIVTASTALFGMNAWADTASDSGSNGPSEDVFESNDQAWACEGDGFIPDHCLNTNSQGNTGNIMVFDGRGPQEGISFDPDSDQRPCPQDSGSSDGTWYNPFEGAMFWVCHKNGNNNR